MPKKDRENKRLKQKIARCEEEYCPIHKKRLIAKVTLTDRQRHQIDIGPECPNCTEEKEALEREIALNPRRVF